MMKSHARAVMMKNHVRVVLKEAVVVMIQNKTVNFQHSLRKGHVREVVLLPPAVGVGKNNNWMTRKDMMTGLMIRTVRVMMRKTRARVVLWVRVIVVVMIQNKTVKFQRTEKKGILRETVLLPPAVGVGKNNVWKSLNMSWANNSVKKSTIYFSNKKVELWIWSLLPIEMFWKYNGETRINYMGWSDQ